MVQRGSHLTSPYLVREFNFDHKKEFLYNVFFFLKSNIKVRESKS